MYKTKSLFVTSLLILSTTRVTVASNEITILCPALVDRLGRKMDGDTIDRFKRDMCGYTVSMYLD
jgi:hypothetical protein